MVKRIGGFRRKTRNKLKKPIRRKGKISITNYFQEFVKGDIVQLHAEPAIQKGMYHPRFHGKNALVKSKKGNCYIVEIRDIRKYKDLIVHPVHLTRR